MGIKHTFTSGIADAADATRVRPSNWNADHVIDGDVDFSGFDILNVGNIAAGGSNLILDRVLDTSTTTGTSTFFLDSDPPTGFQRFGDVYASGDQLVVGIVNADATEWELSRATMYSPNLVSFPNEFDDTSLYGTVVGFSALTGPTVVAPDGSTTAFELKELGSGTHQFAQNPGATPTGGGGNEFTYSIFIKPGLRTWVAIDLYTPSFSGAFFHANFHLTGGGTVGTTSSGSGATLTGTAITAEANGFYRCSMTGNFASETLTTVWIYPETADENYGSYAGSAGATAVSVWYAEVVSDSAPSPYIGLVQVTRSAVLSSSNNDELVNFSAGTKSVFATLSSEFSGGDSNISNPKDFGAFGDGDLHAIVQADIDNNPQWIGPHYGGTWPVGTSWDTVGVQEAIYDAFASRSTPGTVGWNITGSRTDLNKKFFCPVGDYQINAQIYLVANGFEFEFASRFSTVWTWVGGIEFTADTNSNNDITGIDPAVWARLFAYNDTNGMFVIGSGIPESSVIYDKTAADTVNIFPAATTTLSNTLLYATTSMFVCNSAAYGVFRNVTLSCGSTPMPLSGNINGISSSALWVLDYDGQVSGLRTQQLSIYDPVIFGQSRTQVGMCISPSGGAAQGDTITIINPFISACWRAGLQICGANALSIQLIGGDIQACYWDGVQVIAGDVYADMMSTQNQNNSTLAFAPQVGQVQNWGFDFTLAGGGGATSSSFLANIRSESSQFCHNVGDVVCLKNCTAAAADHTGSFRSYPYQLGTLIQPSTNNTLGRSFMCVETGGTNTWRPLTAFGSVFVYTDGAASYTVNQWIGYSFHLREGAAGSVTHDTTGIFANTATTISSSGTRTVDAISLYTITGQSGAGEPNWDGVSSTATLGYFASGGGQGFTIAQGSTACTIGSAIGIGNVNVGDYVVIPGADLVGVSPLTYGTYSGLLPQIICPLIAQITAKPGGSVATLSKAAGYGQFESPGYVGAALTDGDMKWLEIPLPAIQRVTRVENSLFQAGIISDQTTSFATVTTGTRTTTVTEQVAAQPDTGTYATYNPGTVFEGASQTTSLKLDTGTKTATATAGAATLNKKSGIITSESLTTAAGADYTLTVTNSQAAATRIAFASAFLGTSTQGIPTVLSVTPTGTTLVIVVRNLHASLAFNGTIKVSFALLEA